MNQQWDKREWRPPNRSNEDLEKGDETIELGNEEALDQEDAYVKSKWSNRLYKFFI